MAEPNEYPIRLLVGGGDNYGQMLNIVCERPDHSLKTVTIDLSNVVELQLLSFEDVTEGKVIFDDSGLFGRYKLARVILPKKSSVQ